ncbi:uncharacterized protein [Paralichthys olivaceus]|uniref:uncharacterized protein isoform X2 n=1 Tax=Paralichthys olivaceus TaxID=8255 RepID=UPI0037520833
MRGDTSEEEVAAATGSSGRQPRIVRLQQMLRNASQNSFTKDAELLTDVSAAATDVTDDNQRQRSAQNGVNVGSARINPFYEYYLELGSKGQVVERETSEEANLKTSSVPPPQFQSSSLDFHSDAHTTENGNKFAEPQNDPFPTFTPGRVENLFDSPTLAQKEPANVRHHNETLESPDLFNVNSTQTQNTSGAWHSNNSDPFKDEGRDFLQAARGADSPPTARAEEVNLFEKPPHVSVDPFKSPPNKQEDLLRSSQPKVGNPFYTGSTDLFPTESGELFHASDRRDPSTKDNGLFKPRDNVDVFSSPSTDTFDPFSSPIARNLFQDVSSPDDPFGTTPLNQDDPFKDVSHVTPDIFRPRPSNTQPGRAVSEAGLFTPSLNSSSEVKLDVLSTPDLFRATPSESLPATQPNSSSKSHDIILTTPQGTKHGILHPTPFSQARNLSPSQSPADLTHVQTFKRPPKPLPRTRTLRREKPPKPVPPTPSQPIEPEPTVPKTTPKPAFRSLPVIHRKPKTPESKPVNPDNYVVFEDILLIGQERCVEDWPEDSPELDPAFKPSGKFRLRRESLKVKMDSDGGSGEDQDGSGNQKKKDKKFRMSLLSRRGSKDKFPDDTKEGKSRTLPTLRRSSKEHLSEEAENEDEQNGLDYRKKPLSNKVSRLLRRTSTVSAAREGKSANEYSPYETKATVLEDSEAEDRGQAQHEKRKNKMKIKFVPQRGFSITMQKRDDEVKGATGYTPQKGSKDDAFEDVEEIKGFSLQSTSKATFMGDRQETHEFSPGQDQDFYGFDDCKPKKPAKMKLQHKGRRSSKENMLDDASSQRKKSSFSPEELDELYRTEYSKQDDFADDEFTGNHFTSQGEMHYSEQHLDDASKPKKLLKLKGFKKHKAKSKARPPEWDDPPGATSGHFMSEAAEAEWLAAQQDERAMAGFQDEGDDGDTDSLMEWWNTVEQWDELPSDDENKVVHEDDSKSFSILADKVHRGLRVFNKVFTERAEVLWQSIILLHAITDDISEYHKKAKAAGITTTAVGSVTAIAGLALAPFTFGTSLVITAVGVGVATAGGIASASVAINENNTNNMHDRKKVEIALKEYEGHLLDIGKILHFIDKGLYKLRGHPFLRSGTQHYSEDWETRRAVQIISLADAPVMRATEITDGAIASLQGLFKGVDKYFVTDPRELKKGCRKEVVAEIKEVANVLNVAVVELNTIREQLQDATGNM